MNIRHMFLIGVKICLIVCLGFKSSFLYAEDFYTSPEMQEDFLRICQGNDGTHDELRVFFKNGTTTVGNIRRWYLEEKHRDKTKDEVYLHILANRKAGVVVCSNTTIILNDGISIDASFLIIGTTDCQECNKVKEFLAKNITINNEKLIVPEIIVNNPSVLLSDNK